MDNFRKLLTKEQIFTIPNFMSFFRLVLVPFIVWTYLRDEYAIAAALVLVSALTDILDGVVARKFNMVSDLGKVLDPICDKLTHAALLVCLLNHYFYIWPMFALLVVKEITQSILGGIAIKRQETVHSAQWYGKFCTVITESVMIFLVLFPNLPSTLVRGLMWLCCGVMLFSLVRYILFWSAIIRTADKEGND